jgi:hypothetical protein
MYELPRGANVSQCEGESGDGGHAGVARYESARLRRR